MAAFASGLVQGGTNQASSMKDKQKGLVKNIMDKIKMKQQTKQGSKFTDSPITDPTESSASPASAKKGARKIKKSGKMKVHKGERVLTAKQAKKLATKGMSPADAAKHGKSKKKGMMRRGRSKSR